MCTALVGVANERECLFELELCNIKEYKKKLLKFLNFSREFIIKSYLQHTSVCL